MRPISVLRIALPLLLTAAGSLSADPPLRVREVIKPTPGPWGTLEYYRIPLDVPERYLPFLTTPSQRTEWVFPPLGSETNLRALLSEAGIDPVEVDRLLKGSTILSGSEILRVFPTDEAILEMPHETRGRLYRLLSGYEENPYHVRPIYIDSDNLSSWFAGSSFPRTAIEDISKLAYATPRERGFFFSDTPFILRRASSTTEEREILRRLLRRQSLIVRLRVTRENLTREIGEYWTGYKNKAVMPLLESVVAAKDGAAVDIAHLLPATPRQLLNRFPDPGDGISGRLPDWFWTCYNFFRFVPRNVYADSPERTALLFREFEPTLPPLQFGDMLLLNSGTDTIHGCVHIADDIVYTKNGADLFSPWALMRLEDVVAYHDLHGDVSISVYRRKEPVAPPIR